MVAWQPQNRVQSRFLPAAPFKNVVSAPGIQHPETNTHHHRLKQHLKPPEIVPPLGRHNRFGRRRERCGIVMLLTVDIVLAPSTKNLRQKKSPYCAPATTAYWLKIIKNLCWLRHGRGRQGPPGVRRRFLPLWRRAFCYSFETKPLGMEADRPKRPPNQRDDRKIP